MPIPVTVLSFPLDPVRHYLLGQVEYYFSIQNLASDFFLRKQMDSRGWIPIHLIASFNRVRQLTTDVQMVKDILSLSSLIEVRDEHVRLSNELWVSFVLPGAADSTVERDGTGSTQAKNGVYEQRVADDGEREAEEDEEDDVVFVLGQEESRPWRGPN
ncbi:winged helix DNA-binding domain-containing protein [Phellopilus nigrolimitatus]|nr:winged helix DNA-binding domain-containing protein [Phellopilus nigrolimitatus]